jgi:glycosyltransferase involved in cell wall biosynthesis
MEDKLLSVVIPTKNRCKLLARAISSIKDQDWSNIEIIIVDDASTDETKQYLDAISKTDDTIKYIRNESSVGGAKARNQAISSAMGFYIAFLDDDDVWLPNKAKKQIEMLQSDSGLSAVTCDFKIIYSGFPFTRVKKIPMNFAKSDIYASNFLGGASMCLTYRQLILNANGFNEELLSCQDWDLWLKLAQLGEIGSVRDILVYYYNHKEERISSKLKNVYSGRTNIYFTYRDCMTDFIRKRNVAAILFIRIMMRSDSVIKKLKRLKVVYKDTDLRFFLIYCRVIFIGHLRKKAFFQ